MSSIATPATPARGDISRINGIDVQKPLDDPTLAWMRDRLAGKKLRSSYTFPYDPIRVKGSAGVMMLFCNVQTKPHVLYTLRASSLRQHSGEISFPGGKADEVDSSLYETALREVEEEVFIPRTRIDLLGSYLPLPNRTGSLRVYPFIGFVQGELDKASVRYNEDEVTEVYLIPLTQLLDPKNRRLDRFRDTDFQYPVFKADEKHEIWGLTGIVTA